MSRLRKPSAKVLEIASSLHAPAPGSKPKKRKPAAGAPKRAKPKSSPDDKRARLTNVDAEDNIEEAEAGPAASAGRVYCICLGQDDGTPMIQCEGCDNWFHFRCIEMDPSEAGKIEAYFCEICTEVGAGVTRKREDGGAEHMSDYSMDSAEDKRKDSDARISADSDSAAEDEAGPAAKRAKHALPKRGSTSQTRPSATRRKRAEGFESTEDEDEDYLGVGDVEVEEVRKERRPIKSSRKKLAPIRTSHVSTAAQADRTRQHCIGTLGKLLESILAVDPVIAARSKQFATDIEEVIFEQHNEEGLPKTKYLAKFRTLLFNLKSNDVFKDKIATSQLDARAIANASMEDLMTAEQKAMADSIRAKSLKESVKIVESAPRIRRTHKGEEVVDQLPTTDTSFEYRPADNATRREQSVEPGSPRSPPPMSPGSPTSAGLVSSNDGGRAFSPSASEFKRPALPALRRATDSFQLNEEDLGIPETSTRPASLPAEDEEMQIGSPEEMPSPAQVPPSFTSPSPSPALEDKKHERKDSNFDFDSLWGTFKSPTTPKVGHGEAASPAPGTKEEAAVDEDEYDPFEVKSKREADDMDLDALLHPENPPIRSTTPDGAPPPESPTISRSAIIRNLNPVWAGDVIMPDEGGFPASAVQVGGRHLGSSQQVWNTILPQILNIDGRIVSKKATEYLVQCSFASSRELVVIALLPDLTGPSSEKPSKPIAEKSLARHNHLVEYFCGRDRNGVCPPPAHLKKVIKDIYIVPLRPQDPLPEYIELLDSNALGELGQRDADLLLAILVMQKGAIPTALPSSRSTSDLSTAQATPLPQHVSSAASAPAAMPAALAPAMSAPISGPSYAAPALSAPLGMPAMPAYQAAMPVYPSAMPGIDSDALQRLMSQPDVLANLLASNAASQAQPSHVDPNAAYLQSLAGSSSFTQGAPQFQGYAAYGQPAWQPPPHQQTYPSSSGPGPSPSPMRDDWAGREGRGRSADFGNRSRDSGWSSRRGGR